MCFHLMSSNECGRSKKAENSPCRIGLIEERDKLNLILHGGVKGQKIPSPSPTTPPTPSDFIIYILTTLKMLVECTSSVFSPHVFKCLWEDEKT